MVRPEWVTTGTEIPGCRVVRILGPARGVIVRSRSIVGNMVVGLQALFGGNITLLTNLCEQTRGEAFDHMRGHAAQLGANAVIAMRYDSSAISTNMAEVICYGTAVVVAGDAPAQSDAGAKVE